ncbi:porin family protein [Hoeflea sp. YIM 152468]|uniref:outer membrane protein n=1 Tax=Hoeflea sp. YIM 152468 TaxID=3031759 RepID=UPI0023DC0526|nr:outer membrane protein [Hoeflea sp. YIM 152468]MDF1607963.1 porin family protein [Hoeflea sp. YIM 152468]
MFIRIAVTSCIAALTGFAASAHAADLDEIIYAQELPVTQPVEIGTGWYLRGDLGYSLKTRGAATSYSVFNTGPPATYTDTAFDSFALDGGASGSVGFGYNFTDYLRGDLTFDYSRGNFTGTTSSGLACTALGGGQCASVESQNVEQYGFMANAYVDLGTIVGFTPYAGAGAGVTRVTWKDTLASCVSSGGNVCGGIGRARLGAESWRFTYALMAGVSYDLSRDLKLDLGYKYSKVESGNQSGFDTTTMLSGATGYQIRDNGFEKHEIRVGLRYDLW